MFTYLVLAKSVGDWRNELSAKSEKMVSKGVK